MKANPGIDVLIVEDSLSFALELEMLCEQLNFNVLATAADSATALDVIFSTTPDLILMDIHIGGLLTGFEIGDRIRHLGVPILFISSVTDPDVHEAIAKMNSVGFLVKPVQPQTITEALTRIVDEQFQLEESGGVKFVRKADGRDAFYFNHQGSFRRVELSSITDIASDGNYCRFNQLNERTYLIRITMSEVTKLTEGRQFIRCHRQHFVNSLLVRAINTDTGHLVLEGGREVPYSRRNKALVRQLGLLLR